ncbi:TFIID-18kDa-domain-containing protein [Amniculicola lignicola CBS 123094]|uniref:Transcription initiation factor TFIID subunit 13 n=1 Tax=Amniculicola lignicola CBS 123094 TaxID=1392246 RepID=A0A6A5X245_9PLEO|nr:TFIID-18kDa-domain-containing protein [Amniculicola lignicola CBS 123094]
MTEPRMRLRQKGQQFPAQDLEHFLIAFGDDDKPLPETIKVLDEIVTDFIIETCHEAAAVAHHARRAKIKLDDFKFMLRRDTAKLGRMMEMLDKEKSLKHARKAFETDEGTVAKDVSKGEKVPDEKDGGGLEAEGRGKEGSSGKRKAEGEEEPGEKKKKKKKKNREGRDDASTVRSG